ncbi:RNA 2',3'-cyclic phosphodiesterase [Halorhodospira abdelmalekii]|uniref:RNA 2',3'-cyclic phosphodiesterase n=1 Tax=Halorhodospira abdelmalekii TaxID=421629 RepID=UPI0019086441|nr:RNA 2',3'-cyclic phosphodiesterase [Halorhodospira abdelmalekii]MBK1733804.1 RNA 2',3'-cyclic phosphodiesterase [Halorhodospira abdelmalekii]
MDRPQRLFFALWPDDALRSAICSRVPSGHGGRPVARDNLHLTLAFIGAADTAYATCLAEAAQAVRFEPFAIELRGLGCFGKREVLWLGDVTPREPLDRLALDLSAALKPCGFQPEARPFYPHVTVARKLKALPSLGSIEPVRWEVERFCLVASLPTPVGVQYEVVRCYRADAAC